MAKSQYQPAKDQELTDTQEVHYSRDFKHADIAAGYRRQWVKEAKKENPKLID
jgi:hypothetical protein